MRLKEDVVVSKRCGRMLGCPNPIISPSFQENSTYRRFPKRPVLEGIGQGLTLYPSPSNDCNVSGSENLG
jgi:hypothetical protein